ncbi:hypothetical protein GE21DRAFT_4761 [Neurospora crassa]|uniref:ADF-H domain-containing protein n=1 Tax=Neurospora crassa (strain ATCC 24698 / 74-OR23-1A / CBS 708.71 / DSM 1257 / FGSC 987) TaxID=367110 RepID=U9W3C2_NEUCR|nr:uncharacterized protein NCU00432 [Neurospora crassa OR74A]ESA43376.1 hypothetical protein, variant [Neurospora crassa OR74A]KHE87911.1 hypothetical protein GE21DRAFT_4761 [Neurospora crassa]|eukprot:XP_011393843.1 uncharacterized protein NCU00432 [Neurospora crassa OR74A]
MSLNGLDNPAVKEAHEVALVEPGGWFLLKYASRDELELLGQGTGGIVEIRNAIAEYEDKSPLYGYMRYRRRNVILKYLPEGCSRLVQARVTVHFNAICEFLSPYDAEFSIASASELKDTKLSAACSLHTSTASASSITDSLRERLLEEASEEEEQERRETEAESVADEEGRNREDPLSGVSRDPDLASNPDTIHDADARSLAGVLRPSSPTSMMDDSARRMSSHSSRSRQNDYYGYGTYKPRVKLGPRPSVDSVGRPRTGTSGTGENRPVSTIPVGLKVHKALNKKSRAEEQDEDGLESSTIKEDAENKSLATDSTADLAAAKVTETESARPISSGGVEDEVAPTSPIKLEIPTSAPPPPAKQTAITPEKARLLKAMKLREKKKMMSSNSTPKNPTGGAGEAPSAPSSHSLQISEPLSDATTTLVALESANQGPADAEAQSLHNPLITTFQGNSGVDREAAGDHSPVDMRTDSHPTSPIATVATSSDLSESTQASSLLESTDETVLADKEQSLEGAPTLLEQPATMSAAAPTEDRTDAPPAQSVEDVEKQEELAAETKADSQADNSQEETIGTPVAVVENAAAGKAGGAALAPALPISKSSGANDASRNADGDADNQAAISPEAKEGTTPEVDNSAAATDAEDHGSPLPEFPIPNSNSSTRNSKHLADEPSQEVPEIITPGQGDVPGDNVSSQEGQSEVPERRESSAVQTPQARPKSAFEPLRPDYDGVDRDKRLSVVSLSDDDRLMDELQSATVQGAKPITASKSPGSLSPGDVSYKRNSMIETGSSAPRFSRTVSSPVRNTLLSPANVQAGTSRSLSTSAGFLQKMGQQDIKPVTGKIGSSISQRIKALQTLSGAPAGPPDPAPKERPATTFFAVRKPSLRETPSRSPSVADRSPSTTEARTSANPQSQIDTQSGDRSAPSQTAPVYQSQSEEQRAFSRKEGPESVAAEDDASSTRRSSMAVVKEFMKDRLGKGPSSDELPAGLASPRSPSRQSTVQPAQSFKSSRRDSAGSKASSIEHGSPYHAEDEGRLGSSHSNADSTLSPSSGKKDGSRASRFMRRLSNIVPNRKNGAPNISPTLVEEDVPEVQPAGKNPMSPPEVRTVIPQQHRTPPQPSRQAQTSAPQPQVQEPPQPASQPQPPTIVCFMGDVNVQFPDTLLWKRRTACLDSHGFLILSPAQNLSASLQAQAVKRFHMSEFKMPYEPEMEMQELPNSVVLDFKEGSGLQIACGDRTGQLTVLKTLQDAHKSHISFGQ